MSLTDNKFFCDIHCHILPDVDDGSDCMETTALMLKIAYDEGIRKIIATPHYKKSRLNTSIEVISDRLEDVQSYIRDNNLDIQIYQGNEIMYFSDWEKEYQKGYFATLNNSEYVLIEFYPDDDYLRIKNGVDSIEENGLIPVLAHVERYDVLRRDMDKLKYLKDRGALFSVNADSVLGDNGAKEKKFVKKLLKEKLISFVCTDSHNTTDKGPYIKKCAEYLYSRYDEAYVDDILYNNALAITDCGKSKEGI